MLCISIPNHILAPGLTYILRYHRQFTISLIIQCKEPNTESGTINTSVQDMHTYMHTTVGTRSAALVETQTGFYLPAHRSTMPKINMIYHPVTIY